MHWKLTLKYNPNISQHYWEEEGHCGCKVPITKNFEEEDADKVIVKNCKDLQRVNIKLFYSEVRNTLKYEFFFFPKITSAPC